MTTRTSEANLPRDRYWAAVEAERLPEVIRARAELFRKKLDERGLVEIWRKSERTYYGHDGNGGWAESTAVTFGGDDGEVVMARINHYRSIIQAMLAMATGVRPAFSARAVNTDADSLERGPLAEGVVDYTYRAKKMEARHQDATEGAIVVAEGFVHLCWDVYAGKIVERVDRPVYDENGRPVVDQVEQEETVEVEQWDPELGAVVSGPVAQTSIVEVPRTEKWPKREGDVVPYVLGPLEVIRDLDDDAEQQKYKIVPFDANVWELVARYPQLRRQILAERGKERWPRRLWTDTAYETPSDDDDRVRGWYLYHLSTDALPDGRFAMVLGDLVLADVPWPVDEIPVYEIVPQKQMRTAQGYSPVWDLLCLQELYDAAFSNLATAHDSHGIANVIAPAGHDYDPEMIGRGLQLIEYEPDAALPGGGKPEPLNLLSVERQQYDWLQILQRVMEVISGINSVARGDPDANLKSGAALALVSSLAVQFNSALQAAAARLHESLGTGILKLYQHFATTERDAEIAGQGNAFAIEKFSAEKLRGVQRVTIELSNPLMRQKAGQLEEAKYLFDKGAVDRDEYVSFLATGRLDQRFDDAKDEDLQIRRENEALASGRLVPVMDTDRDDVHYRRHKRIFDNPRIRGDARLAKAALEHLKAHFVAMHEKPIEVMWAIGQQIPPWREPGPAGAEEAPQGEAGAPPPGGPPGPPAGMPDPGRAAPLGVPDGAGPLGTTNPDLPRMPVNPATGERVASPQVT